MPGGARDSRGRIEQFPNYILDDDLGAQQGAPPQAAEFAAPRSEVAEKKVPFAFVKDCIQRKVVSTDLMGDLYIYAPFLVLFVFFAYGGRRLLSHGSPFGITEGYYTSRAMRDVVLGNEIDGHEVAKTYEDIVAAADWHAWFATVLVPNVFCPAAPREAGALLTMMGQNYLLGALRIRTQRASNRSCELSTGLFGADPETGELPQSVLDSSPCYGALSDGEQTELLYGFPNGLTERGNSTNSSELLYTWKHCADLRGGQRITGYIERSYHCGGYIVDVPFEMSCFAATWLTQRLDPAGATPFIDNVQTRFVSVEFFAYSPVHNGFTSVKLFAEVSAGGAWMPQYQTRNFVVWTESESLGQTVFDFFFFAFLLFYWYEYVRDAVRYYKAMQPDDSMRGFIFSPWNFLELVNLLCFLASFSLRWVWWDISMQSSVALPYEPHYPEDLDNLLTYWSLQSYINSINIAISFLKILKFFRLNAKLGVLTKVIDSVKIQLLGVMALFVWAVFAFALAGHSLYGSALWEFHDLDTAYVTLLRFLAGDFDLFGVDNPDGLMELMVYPAMRKENRVITFAYFFSYLLVVLFFLLNMIIGILGTGFSAANSREARVPLSEEVERSCRSLRANCRPSRLKQLVKGWRQGSSQHAALRRALEHMTEYRTMVRGEGADADDDATLLQQHDLKAYLGNPEYVSLGPAFIADLWYNITLQYEDTLQTDEHKAELALEAAVREAVDSVVDPAIDQIQMVQKRLPAVEQSIRETVKSVQRLQRSRRSPARTR
eukprot:TRINITY_DN36827_c0_g1_i1.p1 TRINITY_DN36827_c0_g1~~TRINITY_DN36827_c0_g1_i1.p1  ORF type:complete len:805 (+),score=292.48 TRINITY_DN36827_c0_g1_i1:93-2417(+)